MQFETENIALKFGALSIDFTIDLTVINNLDALFEALVNKGSDHPDVVDERIPYWADLWASAIGLSHYLVDNQNIVKDKNVFEIGCGLGLPAIVAGKLGAASTTLTDYLQEALDFIKLVKPQKAFITHISHLMGFHEEVQKQLPENVFLAYDNLIINS